jgi:paraquat-inducible protein B
VGEVSSLSLQPDLQHVLVHLTMHSSLSGHLGPKTMFWIIGASPSLTHLNSLKALIGGPSIGMTPSPGSPPKRFTGLAQPPLETSTKHGTRFVLTASTLGNVSRGTVISYRGLTVGRVDRTSLAPDGRHFTIQAFVSAPYDGLVHDDSRFWNAGAAQLSMASGGPRLQMHSVPALFEGAIAFETPDDNAPRAGKGTQFPLAASEAAARALPGPGALDYRAVFPAPAGDVETGAPVQLDSKRIGSVRRAVLRYDPGTGQLAEEVTLALEPRLVALPEGQSWGGPGGASPGGAKDQFGSGRPRAMMDAMLRRLIAHGLRAEIGSTVPLVGGKNVTLAFVPDAPAASLGDDPVPLIPSGSTGDISGVLHSVESVAAKLQALPLDQIAANLRQVSTHVATLTSSPALEQSLHHLDQTLADAQATMRSLSRSTPALLADLRRASAQADQTLAAAHSVVAGNYLGGPDSAGLPSTLYELRRAARSLRQLADFLDQHPGALISGRSANQ